MIAFYLAASALLALALLFLLRPLLRRRADAPGNASLHANVEAYRQQMQELEADVRGGTLGPDQLDAARRELERRLLDDAAGSKPAVANASARSPRLALVIAASLPVAALRVYADLGTPEGPTVAHQRAADHGSGHGMALEQIDVLAERLAARLAARPDDGQGWAMLARTYAVLGREREALSAYAKAAALASADAQVLADYADALAVSKGRRLEGEPMRLVRRALELDPRNAKALALAGTAAFDKKRYRDAVAYWQRAYAASGDDPEFQSSLGASLEEATALAGMAPGAVTVRSDLSGAASPAARGASGSRVAGAVRGTVTLAPALAAALKPDDTVFIFARAADGPRMPVAMLTKKVRDLPAEFVLDDASAMVPGRKLSDFPRVVVVARASHSGLADPQPGDVEGSSAPVDLGAQGVRVSLDTALK